MMAANGRTNARLLILLLRISLSPVLAIVFVLGCHSQEKVEISNSPLTVEQLQVYSSFLDSFSTLHFTHLANRTGRLDLSDVPEGSACLQGIEFENLPESRRMLHSFGPEITKGRNLKLVDPLEQAKILRGETDSASQKEKSNQRTTEVTSESGFVALSEIAFD